MYCNNHCAVRTTQALTEPDPEVAAVVVVAAALLVSSAELGVEAEAVAEVNDPRTAATILVKTFLWHQT